MNERPSIETIAALARTPVPVDGAALERTLRAIRAPARRWPVRRALLLAPRFSTAVLVVAIAVAFAAGRLTFRADSPPTAPAPAGATPVTFVLVAREAAGVALVGDFNDWTPGRTPLARREGGVWSVVVPLAPGRYSYAFVVDGSTWLPDPDAPPAVDEDFGRPGSVIMVEGRQM